MAVNTMTFEQELLEMIRNILEACEQFFKGIVGFCLLAVCAALGLTVGYFVIMSCYRLCGLAYRYLFQFPWGE